MLAVVDTGPLYAAADADDQDHLRSLDALEAPGVRPFIPAMVVADATYSLERIPDSYFAAEPSSRPHQDARSVARRSVGSFLGWMRANDGLEVVRTDRGPKLSDHSIMHRQRSSDAVLRLGLHRVAGGRRGSSQHAVEPSVPVGRRR
jgi:predicted nucleic acid-binding protein